MLGVPALAIAERPRLNTTAERNRYYVLDMLRGIAAIMVVAYHMGLNMPPMFARAGYLAVDFFFLLSGFVLAAAHERRLGRSETAWWFIRQRILRVYPLYFLGTAMGVAELLGQRVLGIITPFRWLAAMAATSVLMVPYPFGLTLYPLNFVAWSLALELLVNVAMALSLYRLSTAALALVVGTGAAFVAVTTYGHGTIDMGTNWPQVLGGFGRVLYSFPMGMILFRLWGNSAPRRTWWALLPCVPLVAAMAAGFPLGLRVPAEIVVALLVSPAVVLAGIRLDVPGPAEAFCKWLGALSFPLYAIHAPTMFFIHRLRPHLPIPEAVSFTICLGGLIFAASLLSTLYDVPARRLLGRYLPG
jgi:peptidoglycan/LPS O-acetylase OafA/YrhL